MIRMMVLVALMGSLAVGCSTTDEVETAGGVGGGTVEAGEADETSGGRVDLAVKYGVSEQRAAMAYDFAEALCEYNTNCAGYVYEDIELCVQVIADVVVAEGSTAEPALLELMGWTCEDLPRLQDECIDFMWEVSETCETSTSDDWHYEQYQSCSSVYLICE